MILPAAQSALRPLDTEGRSAGVDIQDQRCIEEFSLSYDRRYVQRSVMCRDGSKPTSKIVLPITPRNTRLPQDYLASLSDLAFLRSRTPPKPVSDLKGTVRSADIFSGCGIMTLGLWEACRAIGWQLQPVLAADVDRAALTVYGSNFPSASLFARPIETALNGELGAPPSFEERQLLSSLGKVDFLVSGPPCQGHSDLNNHTRRNDPKNRLYERVARFAELFRPTNIICENVSAVLHDKGRIVETTAQWLRQLGYMVDQAVTDVAALGVPQHRRRHALVASLRRVPDLAGALARLERKPRNVGWAIRDLARLKSRTAFDAVSVPTAANRKRMAYLFRHDVYDLPDRLRPDCHRLKKHSYKSVYGRMHWDLPAQTITSGFTCMGQGRYVHPKAERTLTPHEAARLQFIPDFFGFDDGVGRTALANLIGNAVPPKLTYALALELLR